MAECLIQEKRRQNQIIAVISASVFMFSVDYSMLNISLPSITSYFNATIGSVSRLPLAYLLVVTSTVLLFGKLGDLFGLKKIFSAGLIIFIAGTSLCAFAPTLNVLFILRVFQCFGEAMFSPIGIAVITLPLFRRRYKAGRSGSWLQLRASVSPLGRCSAVI